MSQTSGEPLADVRPLLLGAEAPAGLCDGLVFQIEGEGYTVREGVCRRPSANGETDPMSRAVTIRGGLSPAQRAKTLSHAHIRLGHMNDLPSYETCRGRFEVEAESVAYLVCAEAGLDSADYSVAYAAGWANGDPEVIRETAERVIMVARSITDALAPCPFPADRRWPRLGPPSSGPTRALDHVTACPASRPCGYSAPHRPGPQPPLRSPGKPPMSWRGRIAIYYAVVGGTFGTLTLLGFAASGAQSLNGGAPTLGGDSGVAASMWALLVLTVLVCVLPVPLPRRGAVAR